MGWSVVPCFRSRDHCPVLDEEARTFFALLLEGLKKLDRSLAEGSVSLRWSVEAMNLLKRMQVELVALLKRSQMPISFETEEDWFNQFMQETATLLDLCNSLKCALSGINRYRMVAELVIQKMVQDDSACSLSLKDLEFERLVGEEHETRSSVRATKENVSSTTTSTGSNGNEGRSKLNNSKKSIAAVMLAAKATMVAVSLILVSAIVSPIPIDVASEELISGSPQLLRPFADMLTALIARFRERVSKPDEDGSRFVLAEHEMVGSAVGDLRAQVMQGMVLAGEEEEERERWLESIGLLRTSSAELRQGVEMFDAVVDEVFDVVIRGRKEMLGMFRDGLLSSSTSM
ncbi:uncharacterized protein M6B38_253695 [Iris pallida]|uniref:Uncharacterized protein n=1 Tax=Iris pallida TaxID=29817 RepID=A0AAX6IHT4_IRIPA|nr:uncharacterized protein M6B38_253695 [Iris pallida]